MLEYSDNKGLEGYRTVFTGFVYFDVFSYTSVKVYINCQVP
ncbi:hypothetical protein KKC1_09450 [Calderihabitans maritimus]|uniref:Uncharacterized protein n=1 Tax=Calderihabitans maritimus TaxID=1246530 RepID=A0A1Z5HR45_9FIRM|nr:hypothetical protein KKC1_09450 [Calderihabitans maritimus]